jgi:hypothetical protein
MAEHLAPNTKLVGLHFFDGTAIGATNVPDFFTPFTKTTDMYLMSAIQLISSPHDII